MKSEIIYYMLFNKNIKACHFQIFTNNFTVSLNCKLFMIMKYLMNNCKYSQYTILWHISFS